MARSTAPRTAQARRLAFLALAAALLAPLPRARAQEEIAPPGETVETGAEPAAEPAPAQPPPPPPGPPKGWKGPIAEGPRRERAPRAARPEAARPAAPAPAPAPAAEKPAKAAKESGGYEFAFDDAALDEVVRLVAERTGRTFIYDDKIARERVSIAVPKGEAAMSPEEAYAVFESILKVKGYTTAPLSEKVVKIIPLTDAGGDSVRTVSEEVPSQPTDAFITRLLRPRYVDATELEAVIKPLLGKRGAAVSTYSPTNTLIVTDSSSNIDRLYRIIQSLDVKGFETKLVVIPIEFATAATLATTLSQALGEAPGTPGAAPAAAGRTRRRAAAAAVPQPVPGTPGAPGTPGVEPASPVKIIPDERTNSLIVVGTQAQIDEIRGLIRKLDYETPQAFGKINVYYLEFANADEMAQTLANLAGGGGGASAPAATPQGARRGAQQQQGVPGTAATPQPARGGTTAALEFEGDVKITSDPPTNSLIIVASPQDFVTIREVIRKLDIRRRQVYVEAAILEASPSTVDQIGFELRGGEGKGRQSFVDAGEDGIAGTADDNYTFDLKRILVGGTGTIPGTVGGSGDFLNGVAEALTGTGENLGGPLAGLGSGLSLGAILETIDVPDPNNPGQVIQLPASVFLLRALQSDAETNVISTPHLLTTDNEEAEIVVGQNVPFITGTNSGNNNFTTNVQREDVGITLRFTPQINESDFVRLNLFVEVSALVASAVGQDVNVVGPTTSTRTAQSTVIVKDGQTIVIGGLIQDQETVTETRIPYVADIPILGWLFKFRSTDIRKTNLLLFLTPTIVKDDADVRQVFWERENEVEKVMRKRPTAIMDQWREPPDPEAEWKGRPGWDPRAPKVSVEEPAAAPAKPAPEAEKPEAAGDEDGAPPEAGGFIDIPAPTEVQ